VKFVERKRKGHWKYLFTVACEGSREGEGKKENRGRKEEIKHEASFSSITSSNNEWSGTFVACPVHHLMMRMTRVIKEERWQIYVRGLILKTIYGLGFVLKVMTEGVCLWV